MSRVRLTNGLSENERAIHDKVSSRQDFDPWMADVVVGMLQGLGVSNTAVFLGEGSRVVTFDTSFDQVVKVRKLELLTEIVDSSLVLKPIDIFPVGSRYLVMVSPKIDAENQTKFHQQAIRYELWRRAIDFWDTLPPESDPRMIKNVGLVPEKYGQFSGLPLIFDEGSIKLDGTDGHEIGPDGLRTEKAFRAYQESHLWPEDRIPSNVLDEIVRRDFKWPASQSSIFPHEIRNGGKGMDLAIIAAHARSAAAYERISPTDRGGGKITPG